VKYKLGFYIPEDGILHSHCRENVKSYFFGLLADDGEVDSLTAPAAACSQKYS
jgi:hypothetical protein